MTDRPPAEADRLGAQRLDSYVTVFVLLVATFMFGMAAPATQWAQFVTTALQGLTLIVTMWVSQARRRFRVAVEVLLVCSLAAAALSWITEEDYSQASLGIATSALVLIGPIVIWRGMRRRSLVIDLETVVAAVCVFLMLGLVYASLFGAVAAIDPPFFVEQADANRPELLYFSFVTLTTTGYGDLTAAGNLGRALAVSEAIIGQIYLVTVVALIVGNIGRERPKRSGEA